MRSRVMYIEKFGGLGLPRGSHRPRLLSQTGRTLRYRGRALQPLKGKGYKANYFDTKLGRSTGYPAQRATAMIRCTREFLSNDGYAASLEPRKIYVALRDAAAERNGLLRVVDESGEDYLYSRERFAPLKLPRGLQRALAAVA